MHKELDLWQFIGERLARNESVMLLVVAESSGSSPGRQGYKMAVGTDGGLMGSIGGGVMEVNLVEESRRLLSNTDGAAGRLREQIHRRDVHNSSGMICSGGQTVILRKLTPADLGHVTILITDLEEGARPWLILNENEFKAAHDASEPQNCPLPHFERVDDIFSYLEKPGPQHVLYIIGGGHCSLALSELMSKMDFHITLFDDRPELNTIAKNDFAHEIKIVDSYERIGDHISSGVNAFVVVMTLGYKTDEAVIRTLIDKEFKYFGVLGSKAKMSSMFRELRESGISREKLDSIRTPVGLPINSRTPEEIAVSIAAEIISVKNGPI